MFCRYRPKFKELKKSLSKLKEQRVKEVIEDKAMNLITPSQLTDYGSSKHVKNLVQKVTLLESKSECLQTPSIQEALQVSKICF